MNPTYDFTGQVALHRCQLGHGTGHRPRLRQAGAAVVLADINETTLQAAPTS